MLVSGDPGTGKSSLIFELQKPLAGRRGIMISGKFDLLQRTTPLTGIVAASLAAAPPKNESGRVASA